MATVGFKSFAEGSAMTDEAYAGTRQNVTGRAKDVATRAKDALSVALMEVAAWDFFRWAVVARNEFHRGNHLRNEAWWSGDGRPFPF